MIGSFLLLHTKFLVYKNELAWHRAHTWQLAVKYILLFFFIRFVSFYDETDELSKIETKQQQ